MTEQDLNRLADIIVKKIIDRQAEYDAEFMKYLTENAEVEEFYFMPKAIKSNEEIIVENIERLQAELKTALEKEDYRRAERLKRAIEKFKDKL